jgi:hypothetical protein
MEMMKQLLSECPCLNYLDFIELVKVAVKNMWGDKAVFTAAYPDHDVDKTPIITHKVNLKEPGTVGSGRREIKPRHRFSGTTDTGEKYEIVGQYFDYHVQFDIWGSTGEEADKVVTEFEALMTQYTGYFKKHGVVQFIFERQIDNTMTKAWTAKLTNRSVVYYLKLDETKVITNGDIKAIDVTAQILDLHNKETPTDFLEINISNNGE